MFGQALSVYGTAVEASKRWPNSRARANLIAQQAMAFSALGRKAEAVATAREALQLDPAQPLAAKIGRP